MTQTTLPTSTIDAMREALKDMAAQKLTREIDDLDACNFEEAHDVFVTVSRAALALLDGSKDNG